MLHSSTDAYVATTAAAAVVQVIPPDNYLGPAAGKMTVYEQHAKLLFELSRAQARAASQISRASHQSDTARIAEEEVVRLHGLIKDLEYKHQTQVGFCNAASTVCHLHSTLFDCL